MRAFQAFREASRLSPMRGKLKLLAIPAALFAGAGAVFADEPTEQQIQLLARYSQTLLEKDNIEREIMLREIEATDDAPDDTQPLSEDTWEQMKQVYFELVPVEITPDIEKLFPDEQQLSDMGTFREDVFPNEVVYKVTPTSQLLQLIQSAEQGDENAVARIDQMQQKIKSVKVRFGDTSVLDMDQAIRDGYVQQYKFPSRPVEYHGPDKGRNEFLRYKTPEQRAFEQLSTPYDFDDYQGTRLIENQSPPDLNAPTFEFDTISDTPLPELKSSTDIPNTTNQPKHDVHTDTKINNMIDTHLNQTEQLMHERGHIIKQIKQLTNE